MNIDKRLGVGKYHFFHIEILILIVEQIFDECKLSFCGVYQLLASGNRVDISFKSLVFIFTPVYFSNGIEMRFCQTE